MAVPMVTLPNGLQVSRIINGMWQVSGAHGPVDPHAAANAMDKYLDAGLTTFDMADIYGPAEDIFGLFLKKRMKEKGKFAISGIQGLTKFVPRPGPMPKTVIDNALARSMTKMGVSKLDMIQFHWWDYSDKRYLEAISHLAQAQEEGRVTELSLTNFDTERMQEMVAHGIKLSSNQIQFSLVDMRPAQKMMSYCLQNNIYLLTYGTLCGGLLTDKYLGKREPTSRSELNTASLSKYKQMIDVWGGWSLFQELLCVLRTIADKYGASIANIATKFILDQPAVASVILGCRLGVSGADHVEDTLKAFKIRLSPEDREKIVAVLDKSRNLMDVIGDCGSEYR